MNYRYYIESCGEFTKSADRKNVRLLKAEGRVFESRLSSRPVEAGDTIVVPTIVRREVDLVALIRDTMSIVSGVATLVFIITQLGR